MAEIDTTVVTEATWKPGLPPPIEALQRKFPPEAGCTIEYATWLERDQEDASGWRHIPIAIVTMPDGRQITFFPTRPHSLPIEAAAAATLRPEGRGGGR